MNFKKELLLHTFRHFQTDKIITVILKIWILKFCIHKICLNNAHGYHHEKKFSSY